MTMNMIKNKKIILTSMISIILSTTIHTAESSYLEQATQYYQKINFDLLDSFHLYKNKILALLFSTTHQTENQNNKQSSQTSFIAPKQEEKIEKITITSPAVKEEEKTILNQNTPETIKPAKPQVSEEEILKTIRAITRLIFDDNDQQHISIHLEAMKKLTKDLDPIKHKKIIDVINFLIENQHKSRIRDIMFWVNATKEQKFHEVLPVPEHIAGMSQIKLFELLRKKMALPIQ
jgi:hypothetical protein